MMVRKLVLWVPALVALTATACVVSPTGRRQLSLVSEDAAIGASKEAYVSQLAELRQAGKIVTDTRVTRRTDKITERLVAQAIVNGWWDVGAGGGGYGGLGGGPGDRRGAQGAVHVEEPVRRPGRQPQQR